MLNIAYFSNQFASASGHGIAHYAHRLFDGLQAQSDLTVIPVATGSDREQPDLQALTRDSGLKLLPWGRKLTPLAWMCLNAPPVEQWIDVPIDITHMVAPGFPVATRKKLVVTVHDMGPLTHPEFFADSKPALFKRGMAQTIRQADAIMCVSQATADELVGYAGEAIAKRLHVVHEGVDADFFGKSPRTDVSHLMSEGGPQRAQADQPALGTEVPYFMAAGAMSPRKNMRRLLQAFRLVKDDIPHHLVLTGGGGWDSEDLFRQLNSPELAGRVHHLGYVTDNELQALYKNAGFYVHPSLFEGFGLTVLEAMAAGCPVITSNISSLPEVAGDAALLVDPGSTQAIAGAIQQFATDESLCATYCARGLERVKSFQWEETARKVAEIYRSL